MERALMGEVSEEYLQAGHRSYRKNVFTSLKICAIVFATLSHSTQNRSLELAVL